MKKRQKGMSIVVALFVVVVVAVLAAFAVTVGGAEQQGSVTDAQGSRALAAARTGLEWGTYRAVTGWCNMAAPVRKTQVVPLSEGALRGFQVTVGCTGYQHIEGAVPYYSYDIDSTATYGIFGRTDFASRQVKARYFSPGF